MRYPAVLAVIADGRPVCSVAQQWGVSRQTLNAWLRRYEVGGLEELADRSHRPGWCPHQMPTVVEAAALETCRENGVEHLLTAPPSPTTTGKIERFHRSTRAECLTGQLFRSLPVAQAAVGEWVHSYNTQRPYRQTASASESTSRTPS